MRDAQIEAFKRSSQKEAEELLDLMQNDLEAFGHQVPGSRGSAGYRSTAILHKIDANKFAKVIYGYITSGNSAAIGNQLRVLAGLRHPDVISEERLWAKKVGAQLDNLAAQDGALEKARMVGFWKNYWEIPSGNERSE